MGGKTGTLPAAAPARPSASILLIQAGPPWRLLMMRRPSGAEFVPGACVFPGGSVHAEDHEFADPFRSAALRELFEEMGILLARRAGGGFARARDCERLRALLVEGRSWAAALTGAALAPALDRLVGLTRWVTPEGLPRRFDTRFYLARRPAGQIVHPAGGEVADWFWVGPADALAEDRLELVYPTRRILESVAGEPDGVRLIARWRRRRADLDPIQPKLQRRADGSFEISLDTPVPQRQRSRQRS